MLSLDDLKLRVITENDLDAILRWRNSDNVRRYMLNDHIISPEEHKKWYQHISCDPTCEWHMAEFRGKSIGVVYIKDINHKDGTCTWGMYIGENMRNTGIGVLMQIHAIDRMVRYHKIRKIWGETLESNPRLILMHKMFGFEEEGIFRKHVRRGEQYEDVIRTALFTQRWPVKRRKLVNGLRLREA